MPVGLTVVPFAYFIKNASAFKMDGLMIACVLGIAGMQFVLAFVLRTIAGLIVDSILDREERRRNNLDFIVLLESEIPDSLEEDEEEWSDWDSEQPSNTEIASDISSEVQDLRQKISAVIFARNFVENVRNAPNGNYRIDDYGNLWKDFSVRD